MEKTYEIVEAQNGLFRIYIDGRYFDSETSAERAAEWVAELKAL